MTNKVFYRPYIIWWAVAVHMVWGFALIVDPSVGPVAILVGLHWVITFGIDGVSLGITLLVAASLAIVSLILGKRLNNTTSLLLLLPQYALLLAAIISDSQSIMSGVVETRYIDRLLLFTALWPMIFASILHTAAIFERHITWTR